MSKEINNYFYDLLKEIAEKPNTDISASSPFDNLEVKEPIKYATDESKLDFYNTTIENLSYKTSDTFFSKKYLEDLKHALGNPDEFTEMDFKDRKKVQERVSRLNNVEFSWKSYSKKLVRNTSSEPTSSLFSEAYSEFEKHMVLYLHPEDESLNKTQRAYRNYFLFKFKTFISGFFTSFLQTPLLNKIPLLLDNSDYERIIKDYLSIKLLFDDLLKVTVKIAHDNLLTNPDLDGGTRRGKELYGEMALAIDSAYLRHRYDKILAMTLVTATLNYCHDSDIIKIDLEELSRIIQFTLYNEPNKYAYEKCGWNIHLDNTANILSYYVNCGVFTNTVTVQNKTVMGGTVKTRLKYILPNKITYCFTALNAPRILSPGPVKSYNVDMLIKPVIFGHGTVTKSDNLLKSLTYSRKKRYRISESFLTLCTHLLEHSPYSKIGVLLGESPMDLGFPTESDYNSQKYAYETASTKPAATILNFYIAQQIKTTAVSLKETPIRNFSKTLALSQSTNMESIHYLHAEHEHLLLQETLMARKFAITTCKLAKPFIGFPLHIVDTLCIRLRMYPLEHWISRTSGVFKHLLCEFSSKKITLKGLENLLFCYYAPDKVLNKKFRTYLKGNTLSKKKGFNLLLSFFEDNPLDFTVVDSALYFMNLHMEICKIKKTRTTSVNVEIDQTASGVVFLALLLGDRKMAQVSNLIESTSSCPYSFMMSQTASFIENNLDNKGDIAIKFLCTSRKAHKYALMCYIYSQTHLGRMVDLIDRFVEEMGYFPLEIDRETIKEFSVKYEQFINTTFPGVSRKLAIIYQAADLMVVESGNTSIRTLEGEIITWSFYKHRSTKRTTFNPVDHSTKTYSVRVFEEEAQDESVVRKEQNRFVSDRITHKRKLLSYLIHSIDAAVMRHFIKVMYEKHNCYINHLHDCVILHPNYVDAFYHEVDLLYREKRMFSMASDLIFDQVKSNVSTGSQPKVDKLKNDFVELMDDFYAEINFDPRNLYKPED
jgi:hypothetical protein